MGIDIKATPTSKSGKGKVRTLCQAHGMGRWCRNRDQNRTARNHCFLYHFNRNPRCQHNRALGGIKPGECHRADKFVQRVMPTDILAPQRDAGAV